MAQGQSDRAVRVFAHEVARVSSPGRAKLIASCALCLLALVSGCVSTTEPTPEEIVGQRAINWAETLIALDYEGGLAYMTPSYQSGPRAGRYRGDFSGAGFWNSVKLHSVDCGTVRPAQRCEARMIIYMVRPPELTIETPIPYDTVWILLDGEWYQYRK